jgi:multidrug efflux pump subunit AcrB
MRPLARGQSGHASTRFALLIAAAAVFVWLTARSLPPMVASHFGGDGYANGFMSRGGYVRFMLALVIGFPLLLQVVIGFAFRKPDTRVNLPNREYWLAPQRREQTVAFVRSTMRQFVTMLVVFLCYTHWLVVHANASTPPRLSTPWMLGGLMTFLVLSLLWTRRLLRRFRMRPSDG